LSDEDKEKLKPMIEEVIGENGYTIQLEALDSSSLPFVLTQPEFMRRMKEMQKTGGGGFMGSMPDMYNLVVNTNHELIGNILNTKSNKKRNHLIEQALDLAKLSQNQLKGEALTRFIQRSVDLIK
jgi:molecular chaperone HtpG